MTFNNPNYKLPNPMFKYKLSFKISKLANPKLIEYQFENELVFVPLIEKTNLLYFQTLIDRNIIQKEKNSKQMLLHTTFESTRLQTTDGKKLELYYIEDEDNIFHNNYSEYFMKNKSIDFFDTLELYDVIKSLWKALSKDNYLTLEDYKLIYIYGEIDFNEKHKEDLFYYSAKTDKEKLNYTEFIELCIYFFQSLKAYYIAKHKELTNTYISDKIDKAVEIMNIHFKELDYENNSEIAYIDFKDSLNKENELFSRCEVEIILKQINPNTKFKYWKFDKILRILYSDYFDYNKLVKEDKIYKYLINIFSKQDELQKKVIHYEKIEYALMIENKLNLAKSQVRFVILIRF